MTAALSGGFSSASLGRQFQATTVDAIDWMVGDVGDDVGEPSFRINVVEFATLNECIHDRGAASSGIGAGEEIIFAAETYRLIARSAALLVISRRHLR